MRKAFKKAAGHVLGNHLSFKLLRFLNGKRLIILNYHRVTREAEREDIRQDGICADVASFEAQMSFISRFYRCVSENEVLESIANGGMIHDHSVWVTFDDGYRDVYQNAYPVLKKYSVPATIFIATGYINKQVIPWDDYAAKAIRKTTLKKIEFVWGKREYALFLRTEKEKTAAINSLWKILGTRSLANNDYLTTLTSLLKVKIEDIDDLFMSWGQIKEVSENGLSIGAHTMSHKILSNLSKDEVAKEISGSKNEIEKRLNRNVLSFVYPVGKQQDFCLQACVPILKDNNIELALTTVGGFEKLRPKDRFNLRRVGINYKDDLGCFRTKLGLGGYWQD